VSTRTRIDARFAALKEEGRAGLVTFITAGDPDPETSLALLKALPAAGADIIELGMPFTDPMADGPAIQLASQRALKAGQTMARTLDMVRAFREEDDETPIVLMGYYNPVYVHGNERFLKDAKEAGVDGLIIVDLPPEEDAELCIPAMEAGLNFIRLATPTTDEKRLPKVLANTSGFLYYVSVAGVTGTKEPDIAGVGEAIARIRASFRRENARAGRRAGEGGRCGGRRLGADLRSGRHAGRRGPGDGRDGRKSDRIHPFAGRRTSVLRATGRETGGRISRP